MVLGFGLNNRKRKKDDSSNLHTDYQTPTTDKLKKSIVDSLTSRIKDAAKLPIVQFILNNNKREKKGWIRMLIPTSSFPNNVLSEEERKILFYLRTVFKVRSIPTSALEYAFKVSGPTILSIANGYFEFFDSDPSTTPPHVLHDEKDTSMHVSHQSTPLAQVTKRARTGPTPPVGISVQDKKGEEKMEIELENEDSTNSVTDTPSPRDPADDDNEFVFRAPTFLFNTPTPRMNVAFDETQAGTVPRRYGLFTRIVQSAKKSATRNVSSVGRLLRSAKKAASRNVSALLRSAQKVSHSTTDEIAEAIELLSSEVVNKGVIREELKGLAVAVLDAAAKEESDPFGPFKVRYKPLDAKKKRTTKVYMEIPVPRRAQEDTTEENRKRTIRLRSARLHAYAKCLCGDDVDEQQAAITALVENRMGGFLHWDGKMELDVEDCIAVRERTGGLSTTKLIRALDTISKLLGKRIFPTQLKKKISQVEWGLLEVRHRLVEVEVEKGKKKHCVFYWVPNLPLLQEMLIASAMIDGKYEDSLTFSKYAKAHIFGRGIDRGGDDIIDMTRYVNRAKGNTGEWCIPGAVLEEGAEKYENLEKTILSKDRNKVYEKQQDGRYHFINISLLADANESEQDANKSVHDDNESVQDDNQSVQNANKSVQDARCIMVEFAAPFIPKFEPRHLEVSMCILPEHFMYSSNPAFIDQEDFCDVATYARGKDREDADMVELKPEMLSCHADGSGRYELALKIQMVYYDGIADATLADLEVGFIGCIIFWGETKLYSFRFSAPMSVEGTIELHCKRSILINSDDGKMTTMLCGLGTASASFPCPRCTWHSKQNKLPMWAFREFADLGVTEEMCIDFALREGELSYDTCYGHVEATLGENKEYTATADTIPKTLKDKAMSVVNKPLRTNELDHYHGDALHLFEGMVLHLTEDTHRLIEEIKEGPEQTGSWLEQHKDQAITKADALLKIEKSIDYRVAKTSYGQWNRKCNAKEKELKKAIDEQKSYEAIELLRTELQDLHERKASDSTERGFSLMNRKIRGAKEFKDIVQVKEDAKTWRKNLEKMNEGIFLFDQSIRTQAGNFNKQHGSMELTASRSLMAMEKRHAIHDTASKAFSGTPKDAEMRDIMRWWLEIADHLYEIGLLMKSQELMTPDRLHSLKKNLVLYALKYRQKVTWKNSIFWKAHVSLCCFVNFCEKTGMGGRKSTEGMENNHYIMGLIKAMMQSIVSTGTRVSKQMQRQQIFLLPNVSKKLNMVESKAVRTGKRGPYKTRGNATKTKEVIELLEEEEDSSEIPDGFFVVANGGVLPVEMFQIYNLLKWRTTPETFREHIVNNDELGNVAKLRADHLHL